MRWQKEHREKSKHQRERWVYVGSLTLIIISFLLNQYVFQNGNQLFVKQDDSICGKDNIISSAGEYLEVNQSIEIPTPCHNVKTSVEALDNITVNFKIIALPQNITCVHLISCKGFYVKYGDLEVGEYDVFVTQDGIEGKKLLNLDRIVISKSSK